MKDYHQLYVVCIFIITCKIVHSQFFDFFGQDDFGFDYFDDYVVPEGFHLETLDEINTNYDLNKFTIMPLSNVLLSRLSAVNNGQGRRNTNNGKSNNKKGDAEGEDEENENDGNRRRKRSFTWFKLPFMSDDAKTNTTTTTITTTTKIFGNEGVTTAADTTVDAKSVTTVDNKSFDTDTDVDKLVLNSSMLMAVPYLYLIHKVAISIIDSISSYQVFMLSVYMASIMMAEVQKFEQGESLLTLVTKTLTTAVYDTLLSIRDTGTTISEYASNMYDSLKNMYKSQYKYVPNFFSNHDNINLMPENQVKVNSTITKLHVFDNNAKDLETIETEVETTVVNNNENDAKIQRPINNEMEDTRMIQKLVLEMKNKNDNINDYINNNIIDDDSMSNEEDGNELNTNILDMIMHKSMKFQPDFIRDASGKQLVKYLNNRKILFSQPEIDNKKNFEILMSTFDFDDNVTDEQMNELINVLDKTTNFFRDRSLIKYKQTMNPITN